MRAMLRLTGELDFGFELGTAAYQRFVSSRGSRWPEQERLGRLPALQHTGLSACEITLDGVAYPGCLGGSVKSMFDLRGLSLAQKPYLLITGTGQVCGYWPCSMSAIHAPSSWTTARHARSSSASSSSIMALIITVDVEKILSQSKAAKAGQDHPAKVRKVLEDGYAKLEKAVAKEPEADKRKGLT